MSTNLKTGRSLNYQGQNCLHFGCEARFSVLKITWGSVRAQRKKRNYLGKSLEISSNLGIISGSGSFQGPNILASFGGFLKCLQIKKSKMANSI